MPDISTEIKNIETASRGEVVRDSIISAMNKINQQGGNASTLDGHPSGDFVTAEELQNAITSMADIVDRINGESIQGSITNKLARTEETKGNLKTAIEGLGTTISDNDPFSTYPDKISSAVASFPELNVSENGTYTASSEGAVGYSVVHVNVTGTGGSGGGGTWDGGDPSPKDGPFTVIFCDENGAQLEIVRDVPKGSDVLYPGATDPEKEGYVFTEWRPSNSASTGTETGVENVVSDLMCYPVFIDDETGTQAGVDANGFILDSWETICANHGGPYPIGSVKLLEFDINTAYAIPPSKMGTNGHGGGAIIRGWQPDAASQPYYWVGGTNPDSASSRANSLMMMKVYEGEDGTTSTWVSTSTMGNSSSYNSNMDTAYLNQKGIDYSNWSSNHSGSMYNYSDPSDPVVSAVMSTQGIPGYNAWYIRSFLNGQFKNALIPILRSSIQPVRKYSFVNPSLNDSLGNTDEKFGIIETKDSIWILSAYECGYKDTFTGRRTKSGGGTESYTYTTDYQDKSVRYDSIPHGNWNYFHFAGCLRDVQIGDAFCYIYSNAPSPGNNDEELTQVNVMSGNKGRPYHIGFCL